MADIKLSKKVLSNTIEERKKEYSSNVRVRKDGKQLALPPKPIDYNYIRSPSTHEELVQLADEMKEWSKLDSSTNINDFALSKQYSPYKFKRFNNDYFQDALEQVKYLVSSRNRQMLIDAKFNEKVYFRELPMLDKDVREYDHEILTMKNEQNKGKVPDIVYITATPSTGLVPPKPKLNEKDDNHVE